MASPLVKHSGMAVLLDAIGATLLIVGGEIAGHAFVYGEGNNILLGGSVMFFVGIVFVALGVWWAHAELRLRTVRIGIAVLILTWAFFAYDLYNRHYRIQLPAQPRVVCWPPPDDKTSVEFLQEHWVRALKVRKEVETVDAPCVLKITGADSLGLRNAVAAFFTDNNLKCQVLDNRDDSDPETYVASIPTPAPLNNWIEIHALDGNAAEPKIQGILHRFPLRIHVNWTLPQALRERDPNIVWIDIQRGSLFDWNLGE